MVDDAALWVSDVPRYGVVRTVVHEAPYAAAFDDLNGDGREFCLTLFARTDDGWEKIAYADDSEHPGPDDSAILGWWGGGIWAVGRAAPGAPVTVHVDERTQVVRADDEGWWLQVVEVDEFDSLDTWDNPRLRIRYA